MRSGRARRRRSSDVSQASCAPSTMALFFDPNPRQLQSAAADAAVSALPRDEVHVARRIRVDQVGGRRQEPARQGQRGRDDAGRAAGALRMADHRLGRGARHALGQRAEHRARALRLDGVVELRRRAVVVDVADLVERAVRPIDRTAHRARRSRRRQDPSARGDRRRRSSGSPRPSRRSGAPRARARSSRLDDVHPRAFAEHEAVAAAVERARRLGRPVVVARGHGTHAREAEDHARRHAAVGAARQQHVGLAGADQPRRIAQRVGGTGAAGGQHVADAAQAQRDRHLARDHPDDADGDGVGGDVAPAVREEVAVLRFADVDAAAAAADDHARAGFVDAKAARRSTPRARR